MDPSEIRKKIGRFRILIIGRANAGKTTILQRVCNTRENPEIYNSAGENINPAVLTASRERGLHDINNEMVFRSNPGFVFHDSRGFEAGSESEFDKVKAFIADRSKETRIQNRLHVIWYCIPVDEASRSFTRVEMKFFSECDTGSIPVIVLFTKFDALYEIAYAELRSKGVSREKAEELAPKHAEDSFAIGPQLKFLYNSKDIQRPPTCHVCLPNMDKDDADCGPLIERTAAALNDQVMEQLFVSTTQNNLELCMKYAVEKTLPGLCDSANITAPEGQEQIIGKLGAWFPHVSARDRDPRYLVDRLLEDLGEDITGMTEYLDRNDCEKMQSRLSSVAFGSSPFENILQLSSAAVIVFEHSFYIFDKSRHLQDQQKSVPSFHVALEQYIASPHAAAVREAVRAAVQVYEEAVTTAIHAYEEAMRTSPAWKRKLPFGRFNRKATDAFERSQQEKKSQAKEVLIKMILEITLNHRLPRS